MPDGGGPVSLVTSTGEPLDRLPDVIRPGTTAVVLNEAGEVLLEKRADNGFWGLPGGSVDKGESVAEAIVREVREETGLDVDVKRLIGVYSDPRFYSITRYPNGDVVQYVTACFECEARGGELRMSEESTDIGYFPVDALPEQTVLSHRIRLKDALERRVEPFIR